jgi:1-phosphatidylinositol-4-phosphate 5-kinase
MVKDTEGVYFGNWVNGLREGRGLLKMANGSYYLGMWHMGSRDGIGIFYKSSSNKVFKAEWARDVMHGNAYVR